MALYMADMLAWKDAIGDRSKEAVIAAIDERLLPAMDKVLASSYWDVSSAVRFWRGEHSVRTLHEVVGVEWARAKVDGELRGQVIASRYDEVEGLIVQIDETISLNEFWRGEALGLPVLDAVALAGARAQRAVGGNTGGDYAVSVGDMRASSIVAYGGGGSTKPQPKLPPELSDGCQGWIGGVAVVDRTCGGNVNGGCSTCHRWKGAGDLSTAKPLLLPTAKRCPGWSGVSTVRPDCLGFDVAGNVAECTTCTRKRTEPVERMKCWCGVERIPDYECNGVSDGDCLLSDCETCKRMKGKS